VDAPDLIALFVRPLQDLGVEYMVTGGVAAVVYGDPRFTRDIDIVLKLERAEVSRFISAFDPVHYYVPPSEALAREVGRSRHGHFNVIHKDTGLRADVYLQDSSELQAWGFARRWTLEVEGTDVSLAPAEYVILKKLEYFQDSGSDRHLRDIAMMLEISGERIDLETIRTWSSRLGLEGPWHAAQEFDPR